MKAADTGAYTPPLGYEILTPLYDSAIRYLTREKIWRTALVEQINPQVDDRILDVGCGTGSLLAALSQRCPNAEYVGLDPDAHALNRASEKIENRNVSFASVLPLACCGLGLWLAPCEPERNQWNDDPH